MAVHDTFLINESVDVFSANIKFEVRFELIMPCSKV